jgi:hypothetical protein
MSKITIDNDFFEKYFKNKKRHKNYRRALDVAHHIQFHWNGYFQRPWMDGPGGEASKDANQVNPYFMRLIDQRRPTESIVIHQFRRTNYFPITKTPCHKVTNSLSKIVKCADWKIDYSKAEVPAFLPATDTLETYCESIYPKDNSIENWAYKSLIRWVLTDPNGLMVVMPMDWEIEPGELLRPYSFIIESKDVYEYKEGELAVFLSSSETTYLDDSGKECTGKIIIAVTKDGFYEGRQISADGFDVVEHPHNCSEMPAWLLGGESKTPDVYQPFYESFIQCMLPNLDLAARDSSDLDAEKTMHIFSTMWYMRMQTCTQCQGMGTVLSQGKQVACQTCDGTGGITPSPNKAMELNADNAIFSNKNIPIPPAGYIEKNTQMVDVLVKEIDRNIHSALSSINMEFLAENPMVQSGVAKEVDRDELNNFVYKIAYHIIEEIIKNIYWFINEMRYGLIVPNPTIREKMLPAIPVPQNFDFLTQSDAEDNLIKITGSDVSAELKDLAMVDFLHIKYPDQPHTRHRLMCIHKHNPLPTLSPLELTELQTAGFVRKLDCILSQNITAFVNQLLCENTDFMDLTFTEQRTILYDLAQAKLDEMTQDEEEGAEDEEQVILDEQGQVITDPDLIEKQMVSKKMGNKQRKKVRDDLDNA